MKYEALLTTVGARVRALRERKKLSRRQLSEKSGLSERFLAQLEAGTGNISLLRFAAVADALGSSPAELLAGTAPTEQSIVALLGVRGAGKSSVGQALADRIGARFVEVDQRIEEKAGLTLGEIFGVHGEQYYRRLESEVLRDLLSSEEQLILATGGSIVTDTDNFSMLQSRAKTVWLRARAEDHWERVIAQGDTRPMATRPQAFAELKRLLATRDPLYTTADHIVDTTERTVADVVDLVSNAIGA